MLNKRTLGIDVGAQKCMIVADDHEILLTDTGSINRPTLVSFYGRSRLVGEEAAPQLSSDSTVTMINLLLGQIEQADKEIASHRRVTISSSSSGTLNAEVSYCGHQETFTVTSLFAIFIAKQWKRIKAVYGEKVNLAFVVPPTYDLSLCRAIKEACTIASVDVNSVYFVDAVSAIVSTYGRKLQALRPPEKAFLEGKKAVLIEIGHTQSTVVVAEVGSFEGTDAPQAIGYQFDSKLGSLHFDMLLFTHFATVVKTQHGVEIKPGSKPGQRLLLGCERMRKLLSQLPDAKITVENLTDGGDVNFSLRRDEFASLCAELLSRFRALVLGALAAAGLPFSVDAGLDPAVVAVEIVGGGVRMPVVQAVIAEIFGSGMALGAKFDDASVALGAALVANKTFAGDAAMPSAAPSVVGAGVALLATSLQYTDSHGLSDAELIEAQKREQRMQVTDNELEDLLAARNDLESYILSMRSAKRQKHGEKIDAPALEKLLEDNENWMYDNPDVGLTELREKDTALRTSVSALCQAFFAATEADRVAVEKALEQSAVQAEADKAANGEDDDDHDNRKLKKADRMRLVVKNKDEGTELFKGGNYRPAAARYHKALTHAAKFFDLSPADEDEVKTLKATLHLNLASCYLKMENWDRAMASSTDALDMIGPDESATAVSNKCKAYFRRASAYEAKKEYDKALADIKQCQQLNDIEDKNVTKTAERIKKEIQKEKDKEKKMWGKAFNK